jgi:hypothetical protein
VYGLTIQDFWQISPKEFEKYVEAYDEKIRMQDRLNWIQASYYKASKFPNKPHLEKESKAEKPKMHWEDMKERFSILGKLK